MDPTDPVPPVDLSDIDPQSFTDDELDLPFYLFHFHKLANAVRLEEPNRGFIDLSVWRRQKDNQPYNARIMENILSLAFFYANDRPWNPYYGSPQVRHRLEAALTFWCEIQSPEGKFSEYGPQKWNLAATAFATKFMGESLQWFEKGPPIDQELLNRAKACDRKAMHHVLTDSAFYDFGTRYSNQYSNVWAGALAYLNLYPDDEIHQLLKHRIQQSMASFQSTAGYFYEANGPDWGYNLGTHHSNLHMAFHYASDPEIREMFIEKNRKFSVWLSYNSVPETKLDSFILNRGVECRQSHPSFPIYNWFLNQGIPLTSEDTLSHAYTKDQAAVQLEIEQAKTQMMKRWPEVDSLLVGEFFTYSPYAFLYRNHDRYYPTANERKQALEQWPINRPPFVHQRNDARNETGYTFVNTPAYYLAFNSGKIVRSQQRFGLGLITTKLGDGIMQSQTRSIQASWGTRFHPDSLPIEARDLMPNFIMDQKEILIVPGNRDLKGEVLSIKYQIKHNGTKKLTFFPSRIQVEISVPGSFSEHLPLLMDPAESPQIQADAIVLSQGVRVDAPGTRPKLLFSEPIMANKKLAVVSLEAQNTLVYEIHF